MSELKYNEPAERFAPFVEKSICAGATAVMVPSETGCWVHYVAYCERIAKVKSEADKVIEDLEESHKMEVGQLLMEIVELKKKNDDYRYTIAVLRKEKSHHKYKRCFGKAEMCESKVYHIRRTPLCEMSEHEYWRYENDFWQRWQLRWTELADKFKEAK